MKKLLVISVCSVLALSSCGTYAGSGAYTGSVLGSVLGSAVGGISGGPRGSDVGTLVGMAGGAIVGAAIGNAADQKSQEQYEAYQQNRMQRRSHRQDYEGTYDNSANGNTTTTQPGYDESGFDSSNSADDRIYDFKSSDYTGNYSAQNPSTTLPSSSSVEDLTSNYTYSPSIEICNARFVDNDQDKTIGRGEVCKVIFEVMNRGKEAVYDVFPMVVEASGNRHINISPSVHIEKILPGKGIRYTAMVVADKRIKDGSAKICLSVVQGGNTISKVSEFNIPTHK